MRSINARRRVRRFFVIPVGGGRLRRLWSRYFRRCLRSCLTLRNGFPLQPLNVLEEPTSRSRGVLRRGGLSLRPDLGRLGGFFALLCLLRFRFRALKPPRLTRFRSQQRPTPFRDRLRALVDIERQRRVDGSEKARPVGANGRLARRRELVFHDSRRRVWRTLAGYSLIQRGRKSIDVCPRTLLAARLSVLLVRTISGLYQRAYGPRLPSDIPPRRTKVDQNRASISPDDDVVGRNIAMEVIGFVND